MRRSQRVRLAQGRGWGPGLSSRQKEQHRPRPRAEKVEESQVWPTARALAMRLDVSMRPL